MLHESPLCMGIVHDPEIFSNTCGNYGHATVQKNVFWSFDGYGKGDQVIQENQERKGLASIPVEVLVHVDVKTHISPIVC